LWDANNDTKVSLAAAGDDTFNIVVDSSGKGTSCLGKLSLDDESTRSTSDEGDLAGQIWVIRLSPLVILYVNLLRRSTYSITSQVGNHTKRCSDCSCFGESHSDHLDRLAIYNRSLVNWCADGEWLIVDIVVTSCNKCIVEIVNSLVVPRSTNESVAT
jgi:hypothetical protein